MEIEIVPWYGQQKGEQVTNITEAREWYDEYVTFKWSYHRDNFKLKLWPIFPPVRDHAEVDPEAYSERTYGDVNKRFGLMFGQADSMNLEEKEMIRIVLKKIFNN